VDAPPTNYFKTGDPQGDPLGVHEVVRGWLWGGGSPIEIEPLGHDEDRKHGGIAARLCSLVHNRLEAGACLRIGISPAPVFVDAERFEPEEVGVPIARHRPDEARLAPHPEESDSVHPLDR